MPDKPKKWPTSQDPTKGLGSILLKSPSVPLDEDVRLPFPSDDDSDES